MIPPQARPTSHTISSVMPKVTTWAGSPARTRPASSSTAPSTQPPDTLPTQRPSSLTAILAPGGRGADPLTLVTVASATRWPSALHPSIASSTSTSRLTGAPPWGSPDPPPSVGPPSIASLENLPFSRDLADAIVQHVRPLSAERRPDRGRSGASFPGSSIRSKRTEVALEAHRSYRERRPTRG